MMMMTFKTGQYPGYIGVTHLHGQLGSHNRRHYSFISIEISLLYFYWGQLVIILFGSNLLYFYWG